MSGMEFIPDEPAEPRSPDEFFDGDGEACIMVYGHELYCVPRDRVPTGVIAIVRTVGVPGTDQTPTLHFRGSDGLAAWEAIAMLAEGIRDAQNCIEEAEADTDGLDG